MSVAGGPNVAKRYLRAGLLDEVRILLWPIFLGGGVRLFERVEPAQVELEPAGVVESRT